MKPYVVFCIILSNHLSVMGFTAAGTRTLQTDGSESDVQAALATAGSGYTVLMPAGTFTWSGTLTISNVGVHLEGAGSGRVIGRSTSSVTIGTGAKTFITQSGLQITNGQTLTIERTGTEVVNGIATGVRGYMVGTVSNYTDTNLVMNITSSAGGTNAQHLWIISTSAATTIVHNAPGVLLNLGECRSGNIAIAGIRFVTAAGTDAYVTITPTLGGQPALVHDCYFESTANLDCIRTASNRGVVWNCSFVALPFSRAQLAIHMMCSAEPAWTTPSTMGMADTNGTSNFYVEDCDFDAWLNCTDFAVNCRSVVRHCIMNNSGCGTHGADTGPFGARHYEFYDNQFIYNGYSDGSTLPVNWWFYLRGGTGVITDNDMPSISCQDYGNKMEINMTVMNLQRNGGPDPCWGANIPGIQYPAPRQVGMGRVTGTAGNDSVTYVGDSEPLYIWNNTGKYSVGTTDYGGTECTNPDSSADYIVAGRDYFNDGTSKPGYTKYTYPHPLRQRAELSLLAPPPPAGLRVIGSN